MHTVNVTGTYRYLVECQAAVLLEATRPRKSWRNSLGRWGAWGATMMWMGDGCVITEIARYLSSMYFSWGEGLPDFPLLNPAVLKRQRDKHQRKALLLQDEIFFRHLPPSLKFDHSRHVFCLLFQMRMDGWMNEWTDELMDGCVVRHARIGQNYPLLIFREPIFEFAQQRPLLWVIANCQIMGAPSTHGAELVKLIDEHVSWWPIQPISSCLVLLSAPTWDCHHKGSAS